MCLKSIFLTASLLRGSSRYFVVRGHNFNNCAKAKLAVVANFFACFYENSENRSVLLKKALLNLEFAIYSCRVCYSENENPLGCSQAVVFVNKPVNP